MPNSPSEDSTPKGKAGIVSIAIMCSRILGLVREIVLGGLFGGSRWMDSFMIAFRTPNMLRDLFAEGALSTAFVTTFSKKIKGEGDESAWDLARKMITLVAVFMSGITVLGVLLAPIIVKLMAWGWTDSPEQIQFTVILARIIYGFIGLISLAALVMGMLNSKGYFFVPAIASSFFNLGSIISGALIGYWIDPCWGRWSLVGFAAGVLVGGLFQLLVQLPSLRKIGFRFRPDFRWGDPAVKKVLSLMVPAIISGSAVQVGVALNTFFASFLDREGSVSFLQWAFRLMQLPLGVFGVAVATVTLPAISRAAAEGVSDEFRNILSRGVRLVFLMTIPSALGLALLAEPIISVIFQRGRFTADDAIATAAALQMYAMGLIFYAGIKVVQPAFYAIDKKWIPMYVSFFSIATNAVLNYFWIFVLDKSHEYLALSTAISSLLNFSLLYIMMRIFAGHFHTGKLISTVFRIMIAGVALSAVALISKFTILAEWATMPFPPKAIALGVTIAVAAAAYFGVARMLRIEEMDEFLAMVKRRAKR